MNNELVKQKNRVHGLVITKAIMANQNADFDGQPRQTNDNKYYATSHSLKYTIKEMAKGMDNQLLGIERKTYNKKLGKMQPLNLEESYIELFGPFPKSNNKDATRIVLSNLATCFDVKTFGSTFAHKEFSQPIHGSIQISEGFNKLKDTATETIDVNSSYRNKPNDLQTSIGQRFVVNKAVYVFNLTINPKVLDIFEEFGLFLDTETVEKVKEFSVSSITMYHSQSKNGCSNVASVFVNLKDDSNRALHPLSEYIEIDYEDPTTTIDFTKLESYLELVKDDIDNIEIMYAKGTNLKIIKNSQELKYIIKEI